MGFILVAIILAIVSEVFLLKLYNNGEKQFKKYNKEHSDVQASNAEDFLSKVNAISNLGVKNAECIGNTVNITYENNKYVITVENGIAFVEYDKSGCEFRISSIGRLFKLFQFSKSSKKATAINYLMDCISNKNVAEHIKEYKKVNNSAKSFYILFLAMIICLIIGIVSLIGNDQKTAITKVKNTEFIHGVTYEEIIEGYLITSDWTAFNSNTNSMIVEVNGVSIENEVICIQFMGDPGKGFNSVSSQNFSLYYFDADGVSLNPVMAMEYIYGYSLY